MKHRSFFIILLALMLLLNSCGLQSRQSQVRSSLARCEEIAFYTSGGFQDYTDFAMYSVSDSDQENSGYFAPVTQEDIPGIHAFLDDFEGWIDAIHQSDPDNEVVVNYAFDRSIIDAGDHFYIYEDEDYPKFGCYDVWLLDAETSVLYYFHSNI